MTVENAKLLRAVGRGLLNAADELDPAPDPGPSNPPPNNPPDLPPDLPPPVEPEPEGPTTAEFHVDTDSVAAREAVKLRQAGSVADAEMVEWLAAKPAGKWLGKWDNDATGTRAYADGARGTGKYVQLVQYYVPMRDLGGESKGGAESLEEYLAFTSRHVKAVGSGVKAMVVIEPDAITQPEVIAPERITALRKAIDLWLSLGDDVEVYLDAGHPLWRPDPATMAARINLVNPPPEVGFSLNVSNFRPLLECMVYGEKISEITKRKFVIDTSRSGGAVPPPGWQWCNPPGQAAGPAPTFETGSNNCRALLWTKRPGESDGQGWDGPGGWCGGCPPAGAWCEHWALDFLRRTFGK